MQHCKFGNIQKHCIMTDFSHLHCHTQFSLLDGASGIPAIMAKAKADKMRAVALTDHGNMFGAFQFVNEAEKQGVKPIVGCEFYVVEDRFRKSFGGGDKDKRYHQLILAKNQKGYENLSKLCSLGFIDGLYGKYPRVDKALIKQYSEGLIATSCCIGAEVPQTIINKGEAEGEKVFLEWLDIFGDDYFLELQRHGLKNLDNSGVSQEDINQILLKWSKKYNVPAIATNDSHYINEEDSSAHDILLCVNTGDLKKTPLGSGKGYRFGFPNNEFFFKTQAEMLKIFGDIPETLDNTGIIVDRITSPKLDKSILLPNYIIPANFKDQDEYLRYLSYEGAKIRYGEITEIVRERMDMELATVKKAGFPGYFLIVQDFTTAARKMGVAVGPGRGSAAGSVVAYCLGITNVDPLKYGLLFERFLNPERISMPDIDIDFDDVGRSKVLDYVIKKYGQRQVAQIITYGSMAAKSSIRDVGRVLDVPLSIVDQVAKMVPDISLRDAFDMPLDKLKENLRVEQMDSVKILRGMMEQKGEVSDVLKMAKKLEGSVRNTGVHACGVIITPTDITDLIPVAVSKDSDMLITQFDNSVVERAGLLKMDFLGLKTLSIISDAIKLIGEKHGVKIDPDTIDLTDEKTIKLFQEGKTIGIFQFESDGMQKYLKDLKPTRFEDLIAMNALYRPGPLSYIPTFVNRKNGKEDIVYDDEAMKEFLEETYGITVYQEQVMLLSEKLGGFSKGKADILRKAMGKKSRSLLDSLKDEFLDGAEARGHERKVMEKVWTDWESFAQYAFNKSHSTCYSVVAFQTGFLKANYPAEFMAAVLTHNMNDIKKIGFFIEECKGMNLTVLPPDINESKLQFAVNKQGAIRFGLAAVKGVGEAAAEEIIRESTENGAYETLFDLTCRVNLRTVNKKSLEALATAGGFDNFPETHRAQYVEKMADDAQNGVELAIRYGTQFQTNQSAAQTSLFGAQSDVQLTAPQLPKIEAWTKLALLNKEKEMLGIFVSGHPLDGYKVYIDNFCTVSLQTLKNSSKDYMDKEVKFAGIVNQCQDRTTKGGKPFGIYSVEDYEGAYEMALFGDDYAKFRGYLTIGSMLYIQGKMEKDYRDPEAAKLRIMTISYMQDMEAKFLKYITISLPLNELNEPMVDKLKSKLTSPEKGGAPVNFKLYDLDEKTVVHLKARNFKTSLDEHFLKSMKELGLKYSIN
jgi:DNA polymerase-3 subunit alpha